MFGRKCSLCGSRLDSRKICTECGLDNSKSEKYYKVNQSSCDNMPMTHVHKETKGLTDDWKDRMEELKEKAEYEYKWKPQQTDPFEQAAREQSAKTKKNRRKQKRQRKAVSASGLGKKIIAIVVAMNLIPAAIELVTGIYSDTNDYGYESEYVEEDTWDPYEFVDEELPADGGFVEYELATGEYIVGLHIPAGNYVAQPAGDYDTVQVSMSEHGIYLYEYRAKEKNYLEDLRFYPGDVVQITATEPMFIYSENAQTQDMIDGMANPVTEGFELADQIDDEDTYKAGLDFEPGVYNLSVTEGYANVVMDISDTDKGIYDMRSLEMGETCGTNYYNMVIPEGATIFIDSDNPVSFVPAEQIQDEDYLGYYAN